MKSLARMQTSPIDVIRSMRRHDVRVLTSLPAGKMVPLRAFPLLREDSLDRMSLRLSFEMAETVEILMNAVNVNVKAYLVPHLAFKRFSGMDELNRSFAGQPNQEGGPVTPYFETNVVPAGGAGDWPIFKYMGIHAAGGETINQSYIQAYNQIWNFRAKNRSPDIALRTEYQTSLAPAFWQHSQFNHIVPDFEQAIIDGKVPLNLVSGELPVKMKTGSTAIGVKYGGGPTTGNLAVKADGSLTTTGANPASQQALTLQDISGIVAELQNNNVWLSLSNIELARKTQAFAKLRAQFAGFDDEYITDMLMDGLTIPEQAFKQPILLAEKSTVFGMSKRYASDAANLTESVVNGMTQIDMMLRTPRVPMGGVVMIVAEITPEQLFERQQDPFVYITDPDKLPHYLRDTLDPEKVEVVQNRYVDTAHGTPNGTFGYAPLNHKWNASAPGIGGKFYRPSVNTSFDEVRQRIWSVETLNPSLSADFYLCTQMHQKPFVVTSGDPFEVVVRGEGVISGNTVFGQPLIEGMGQYDEVTEELGTEQNRITGVV